MRCSFIVLTIGFIVLAVSNACADYGPWNFSVGPQLAWSWGRSSGISWGWEGGVGFGVQRLNLGQLHGNKGQNLSYVVVEPYTLYIGGSLGIVYQKDLGISPILGLWEGVPVIYPTNCEPDRRTEFGFLLTMALGYRYFGGHHQVYATPKVGVSQSATSCITGAGVSGGVV
jgi:hypothetical protein